MFGQDQSTQDSSNAAPRFERKGRVRCGSHGTASVACLCHGSGMLETPFLLRLCTFSVLSATLLGLQTGIACHLLRTFMSFLLLIIQALITEFEDSPLSLGELGAAHNG